MYVSVMQGIENSKARNVTENLAPQLLIGISVRLFVFLVITYYTQHMRLWHCYNYGAAVIGYTWQIRLIKGNTQYMHDNTSTH